MPGSRPPRGEPCSISCSAFDRLDQLRRKLQDPPKAKHVRDEVVGKHRQPPDVVRTVLTPARVRSAAASCARLRNGTFEIGIGRAVGEAAPPRKRRDQRDRGILRRSRRLREKRSSELPARQGGRRGRAARRRTAPSARARGSWPVTVAASSPGSRPGRARARVHGPLSQSAGASHRPRSCRSLSNPGCVPQRREPAGAEVDRIQRQPERHQFVPLPLARLRIRVSWGLASVTGRRE